MKLAYCPLLSLLLNILFGQPAIGIGRGRASSYKKLYHGEIYNVARTAKPVRKRVVENIELVFQVVRDHVNHCVHVASIVYHEISNFRCDSIFSYELHDGFGHVLAVVLSFQFFYPHYKGLETVILGYELNYKTNYS